MIHRAGEIHHDASELGTSDGGAVELVMGPIKHGEFEAKTDNTGARDVCYRNTVTGNQRHVDRKVFKMREMRREKKAKVKHISTHENASDMLTKALDNTTFHRHRATNMNLAAVA